MDAAAAEKLRVRLSKLFALIGSNNAGEREAARLKIDELLAQNKKTWNDLVELLSTGKTEDWSDDTDEAPPSDAVGSQPASLDLIVHILRRHLHMTEHQYVAVALWIAHTFVYTRFSVTPRLALTSPVRGCGKTTALDIISELACKTVKTDHITAAVLFRLVDRDRPTLLIDEADNQDLPSNATLRAVINSGHHDGGKIMRFLDGEITKFTTFAPLAIACIGKLPFPILHRSVVIRMERSPEAAKLTRFDPKINEEQKLDCQTVYDVTLRWIRQAELNLNPKMPAGLRNRAADNWRVLISIADANGLAWGKAAREAAVALSKNQDEDLSVILLTSIREIFNRRPTVDRLNNAVIVTDLNNLPDAPWSEWRGLLDDQTPRQLSQGQLAQVLSPFDIRPRTIWPSRRGTASKSAKGYFRKDFEVAWAAYCAEDGTPAQPNNVRYLHPKETSK
jgi:hypothetical protein